MSASFLSALLLFAEEAGGAGGGNGAAAPQGPGALFQILTLFAPLILLFYFFILRPERRKQGDHQKLLESLKKNDRVVTIGGIYGVVANVQREADRVTLKIDETNNTKIDVTFSAVARVLTDQGEGESKS